MWGPVVISFSAWSTFINRTIVLGVSSTNLPIPNAPWCWNIYQHLPSKSPSYVCKYTSTMEHMGILLQPSYLYYLRVPHWLTRHRDVPQYPHLFDSPRIAISSSCCCTFGEHPGGEHLHFPSIESRSLFSVVETHALWHDWFPFLGVKLWKTLLHIGQIQKCLCWQNHSGCNLNSPILYFLQTYLHVDCGWNRIFLLINRWNLYNICFLMSFCW